MDHENEHFEGMTDEERQLSDLLDVAMKVTAPGGLSERVVAESQHSLQGKLHKQLDIACAVHQRDGLAGRCFEASVTSLQAEDDRYSVIAHIDSRAKWHQVALAACLVFAALVAIRFGMQTQPEMTAEKVVASTIDLSVEELELLLEDSDLSEYTYLADTRELAFADVSESFNMLRNDLELWQYGLLSE